MEQLLEQAVPSSPEPAWQDGHFLKALLNIPQGGMIGVTSALLFSGPQHLCAYWWRDPESGEDYANLVDEERLRLAIGRVSLDSGYVPAGTLRLGMSPKGAQWLLLSRPPKRYQLTLEFSASQVETLHLRMPSGVFFGIGDHYYLWAVKKGAISGKTPLYHYPLPNISEHGLLCFGENTPPKAAWSGIFPALNLFLDSPFIGHWAQGKSTVHHGDIRERLQTLAGASPAAFPDEELVLIPDPALVYQNPQPVTLDSYLARVMKKYA